MSLKKGGRGGSGRRMKSQRDDPRVIGCPRRSVDGGREGQDGREIRKKTREKNKTGRGGSQNTRTRRGGDLEWRRKSRRRWFGGRRGVTGETDCHSSPTNKPLDGISFLIGPPLSGRSGPPRSARGKQPGHFTRTTPTPIGGEG